MCVVNVCVYICVHTYLSYYVYLWPTVYGCIGCGVSGVHTDQDEGSGTFS